ncbi:MAG: galactose-1-phosphate uridylyltransferase, partial [Patescibacteria group bacterium]
FPRRHSPRFEKVTASGITSAAEVLRVTLAKLMRGLNDPDYNFFIHTAPTGELDVNPHEFYSWHIEILPKLGMSGAFELGSGIDVNSVDPDQAAEELRKA